MSFEATKSTNLADYLVIEPLEGLRLLKLGVIYGANASGKTTLLKGLNFLKNLILRGAREKTDQIKFEPFLFDVNTPHQNSQFELNFFHHNTKFRYKIELNRNTVISERLDFTKEKRYKKLFERTTDTENKTTSIGFGKVGISKQDEGHLEFNTLWNNTVLTGYNRTNVSSPELDSVIDWFYNVLQGIITPNTNLEEFTNRRIKDGQVDMDLLLQFLKNADFKISNIKIEEKEEEIPVPAFEGQGVSNYSALYRTRLSSIFEHKVVSSDKEKSYDLPYESESLGTQRYYQFGGLLEMMLSKPTVMSIDELESSLHPDLIKHFILTFIVNSKESQLLTTTHFRELLDGRGDYLRDDNYWFTEKKDDGSTDLYSLSDFDSTVVRNTTSVYNKYKNGQLGAVPNLGDYHLEVNNGEKV